MAQPNPDTKVTLESVLKLVELLDSVDQQKLGETLNRLQALRQAIDVGIDQLDQGQGIPADQAFDSRLARYNQK